MNKRIRELLQIRYIKLHFTVVFTEDTVMPKYKASALRGGMGEMLLRANCISDRNCAVCGFEPECVVRRTMYSKFERRPEFVTSGESVGYVLECENYTEVFRAGDEMEFCLLLFGRTIVYFNLFLQAFYALGMCGIGKYKSRFQVASVANSKKESILEGNNDIYMQRYQVMNVADYVAYRMGGAGSGAVCEMVFKTPLALKYQGEMLREFHMEAIIKSAARRIYMLDCYEGLDAGPYESAPGQVPEMLSQKARHIAVPRYSSTQDSKMVLHGIEGSVAFEAPGEDVLALLYAGELLHIGKNTSFGFGRYRVRRGS